MTTVMEKSATVAKGLVKSGMRAKGYERGPIGKDIMALRIGPLDGQKAREGIRLWTGLADCDISDIAKSNKQAVLAVNEPARTVTRSYEVSHRGGEWGPTMAQAARNGYGFPVTMPGRPKFKIESQKVLREADSSWDGRTTEYLITASMAVKETEMTLLMGIDETSHFICALPERVSTVRDAHDVLRPDTVPVGSLRQGEWFFVPATQDEIDSLYRHIADSTTVPKKHSWDSGPRFTSYAMERGSSHHALIVTVPDVGKFTIGIVKDGRKGHHKELVLPTWHKVIRNTEVVFAEPKTPQQRAMARTWD